MKSEYLLLLNIILPLIASAASFIKHKYMMRASIVSASLLLCINNILMLFYMDNGNVILTNFLDDYQLSLSVNAYSVIFSLMVTSLYFMTNLYSFVYLDAQESFSLEKDLNPRIHLFFTPIAIMATLNIGYSSNLITLFVFYELLTLSTYPLVIQSFSDNARKAGRYYLGILFTSSTFFLTMALIFIDNKYGATFFKEGGIFLGNTDIKEVILLLICFVFGFSKTAIFPLHRWLPKAMVAPIPVSALLHAVAVVKSGVFALIKVFIYLFGIDFLSKIKQSSMALDWIILLACFTIIFSGIKACRQTKLKKILAYSTISQLSYMILSLSFVTSDSVVASFLHLLSHSIAKITLFFTAGIIYVTLHKVDINNMRGIVRILPIPVILFILAALSIIGLPFTLGGLTGSKIYESISCDNLIVSIAVSCLLISKVLACYYFAKVIFQMISPASEVHIVHYKPTYLIWITFITFSLSILVIFYFEEINLALHKIN